jgi:iron complex outermembrane receptor protein
MNGRFLCVAALTLALAQAQRVGSPTDELTNLSVDDLFRLQITSVDRKAQQLSKAPAAIFVLTADDIRRSGATSIPEALQWVPGLTVLRVDGRMWTVSARGSARLYSDKMLVMIDGRSLYTPLLSGVLWDIVDVPLENVERIEIVRGPGAVMWGPNAVNGVINIITKKTTGTPGALVSLQTGNELRGSAFARWRAAPSDRFSYQVWTKVEDRNPAFDSPGFYRPDAATTIEQPWPVTDLNAVSGRAGFRLDAKSSDQDQWMVKGDVFRLGRQDALAYPVLMPGVVDFENGRTSALGGFVEGRWTRTTSPGDESTLQFAYDKNVIDYPFVGEKFSNFTADFQQRLETAERNELHWGLGFQQYWDHTETVRSYLSLDPLDASYRDADAVVRDEFQLIPDRLAVSAGMRVDYSSYTHFEFQPSFRLLYTPNARESIWFAVSRAVRVPSRLDRDARNVNGAILMGGLPINLAIDGSPDVRSEVERSVEAGYRAQSGQRWSVDFSLFWSYYDRLVSVGLPEQPSIRWNGSDPQLWITATEQNSGRGRSYGGEVSSTWQVTSTWRLMPSYSYLNEAKWLPPGDGWMLNTSSPRHQAWLRSQHDLSLKWQADLMARARSRNIPFNTPGALLFDARIGWRPNRDTEFSVSVQNLTGRTVVETYAESPFASIPLQRTFVFKWTQKF